MGVKAPSRPSGTDAGILSSSALSQDFFGILLAKLVNDPIDGVGIDWIKDGLSIPDNIGVEIPAMVSATRPG